MEKLTEQRVRILLADDDRDDRYFFEKALLEAGTPADLVMLENGELLMTYLHNCREETLPQLLFLDLNMPRRNGAECLHEIKSSQHLKLIPVIIYSTSLHDDVADLLYQKGAHYYIRKTDYPDLKIILSEVLQRLTSGKFTKPDRDHFVINATYHNHS